MTIMLAQSPGAFTAAGSITAARAFRSATWLTSAEVLIAGASAELYDLSTEILSVTGGMTTAR
ncbi:MAG TPA: hypothetical protein VGN17_20020 [Bryobacteraceae bacterium]